MPEESPSKGAELPLCDVALPRAEQAAGKASRRNQPPTRRWEVYQKRLEHRNCDAAVLKRKSKIQRSTATGCTGRLRLRPADVPGAGRPAPSGWRGLDGRTDARLTARPPPLPSVGPGPPFPATPPRREERGRGGAPAMAARPAGRGGGERRPRGVNKARRAGPRRSGKRGAGGGGGGGRSGG